MANLALTDRTKITLSVAAVASLFITGIYFGSWKTGVEARTDKNAEDIQAILVRWDKQLELNEKQATTNKELNDNIIKLTAQLEAIKTVSVSRTTPQARVTVVSSPPNTVRMNSPSRQEEPKQPEPSNPLQPAVNVVQRLVDELGVFL